MKTRIAILFATMCAASAFAKDEADIRKLFAQAGQSYDAGQFKEAVTGFEQIFDEGFLSPELFYNLGDAYFKAGDPGRAILNYRRAWTLLPRDAELSANLHFAIQNAGALAPEATYVSAALSRLSRTEWIHVSVIAYWFAASMGICFFVIKGRRALFQRLCFAGLGALIIGLAGLWHWWDYERRPEFVVTAPNQQALFAPLPNSTPHFALPVGSIVRLEEKSGPWIRVASGRESGWIPETAGEPVLAWHRVPHT